MNFKTVLNKELPFIKENGYYFHIFNNCSVIYLIKIIKIREKRITVKWSYFSNSDLPYSIEFINLPHQRSRYIDGEDYFMRYFFTDYTFYKLNQINYLTYEPYHKQPIK
jgi:hypothetical protein